MASKGLAALPRTKGTPGPMAVAGRAVGRCRCRGRPPCQPACGYGAEEVVDGRVVQLGVVKVILVHVHLVRVRVRVGVGVTVRVGVVVGVRVRVRVRVRCRLRRRGRPAWHRE